MHKHAKENKIHMENIFYVVHLLWLLSNSNILGSIWVTIKQTILSFLFKSTRIILEWVYSR